MALKIGIVGLPNVGKSTLFQALTQNEVDAANYPFATIEPNIGIVEVEDERIKKLGEFSKSEKVIPAAIEFVDIAGLVRGAHEGEGLGNQFLANIREVDAIVEVVRDFENSEIIHVENSVDPERDIGTIETELFMADLSTAEKALARAEKESKTGSKEAKKRFEDCKKLKDLIANGKRPGEDLEYLGKELSLLSTKPVLYLFNITDDRDPVKDGKLYLNIKMEEELSRMSPEEEKELGMESRLPVLAMEAYRLLGLISYFTTGVTETRAWTIPEGSTAKRAGRAIHSDFEEKFIRAEIIFWKDLLDAGSYGAAREKGLVRTEGKEYIVKDGDVIEFKI